jgi:hypothetical protein
MSLSSVLVALLIVNATSEWQSRSQDPPPPQDPPVTRVDDIVVEGRPLRAVVDDFVDEVIAPPVGRGPARWNRRVCVGVVNLRSEAAQALADQVSAVALRAGLEVGEPGCNPNILVIWTDDAPALARALVARRPRAFRPQYSGAAQSSEALERFQDTEAPVRWWHVSMPVVRETGLPGVRMPGEPPPTIAGEGRLRSPLRNDLLKAFIIVDLRAAEGLDLRQLGDYIGMVALAQVDAQADTRGHDTILNLFQPDVSPGLRLTDWDVSFLEALYDAELHQRQNRSQFGEVIRDMTRRRQDAADDAEGE